MPSRLALRSAVRTKLADLGVSPVWDDQTLNDAIAHALDIYSSTFPREVSQAVAVVAGTKSYVVAGVLDDTVILRLVDNRGRDVPRAGVERSGPFPYPSAVTFNLEQAWRFWAGSLEIEHTPTASDAGTWTLQFRGVYPRPPDDATDIPFPAGDQPIVEALAIAQALATRAVEDGKRGSRTSAAALGRMWAEMAAELIRRRRRRVKSGWLA